jgi:hypothetical protein
MLAKSDELVRKNKSLRQKNKGMLMSAYRVIIGGVLYGSLTSPLSCLQILRPRWSS